MRIALDAMGTDRAPATEVEGAIEALRELDSDIEIVLVGDQEAIEVELARHEGAPLDRLHVQHAADRVLPGDAPAAVVRRKPASSIVVGLRLQADGHADAFISDATWAGLTRSFEQRQLMDLVFTVGTYTLLAMAFNSFGIQLDPGLDPGD